MTKTELCKSLQEFLADKEEIANDAAPALKLMRQCLAELEKPTSGTGDDLHLRGELASADSTIAKLQDIVRDREGYIYGLLAELAMVPEIDEEPVDSLLAAYEQSPSILDDLQEKVASMFAREDAADKDRFINGVRALLEVDAGDGLQRLWDVLESKAQYLNGLETGIAQRDEILLQADARMLAVREKLGIPATAHGTVEQLEIPAIDLIMQQRQAAQDRLVVGRDEAPAEGTLEAIIEQIILIMKMDWQDVEALPQEIQQLRNDANRMLRDANLAVSGNVPLAGWVSDSIDLAHAVRANLAPENRVMAKAAEAIILGAPGVSDA